jgi:hypothetical protein
MVSQKHMAKLLKHYRGRFANGAWGGARLRDGERGLL